MNDALTMTAAAASAPIVPRPNGVWHWWIGELRALVPPRLMSWVVGDVAVTDMMIDGAGIHLVRLDAGKLTTTATIPSGEVTTHPLLRELRAKGNTQIRVLLDSRQVLQKNIILPAAVEENLREVMGFELDRHTPFTAAQAYYDVKLRKRDPQHESIDVLLAVGSRNSVDPLLALVRQTGLSVEGVGIADADPLGQTIELLPAGDKPARKWGNLLTINLALFALATMLMLIALLLPIWQKREAVIALNPLVARASAEYEISQRLNDDYIKLANEHNYITGRKQSTYSSIAILEELTRISPDTTVAQSFDLKSTGKTREVTLIGEAMAVSKVIEALEQSPLFQNASQRSISRKGSQGINEWFHVATELKPKALPPAAVPGEKTIRGDVIVAPSIVAPVAPTAVATPGDAAPNATTAATAANGNSTATLLTPPAKTDAPAAPAAAKPALVPAAPTPANVNHRKQQ